MTIVLYIQNSSVNPFDSVVAIDATFASSNFNGVGGGDDKLFDRGTDDRLPTEKQTIY